MSPWLYIPGSAILGFAWLETCFHLIELAKFLGGFE